MQPYNILITGGAGFVGAYLCEKLLDSGFLGDSLTVFSRDELKHFNLKLQLGSPKLRFTIGDIRDQGRLQEAMKGVDLVIHTAALKQVATCEYNAGECMKTNVHGTENLLSVAAEAGVKKFIFLSTDKAVDPISVYGNAKQLGEKMVLAANRAGFETVVLRHGNMLGSTGSVLDKVSKQSVETLFVPHAEMTRFADSPANSWFLIQEAIKRNYGGCILVPRLRSVKITELVRQNGATPIIDGSLMTDFEKVHEKLITDRELEKTIEKHDYFVVPPGKLSTDEAIDQYEGLRTSVREYSSASDWVGAADINQIEIEGIGKG